MVGRGSVCGTAGEGVRGESVGMPMGGGRVVVEKLWGFGGYKASLFSGPSNLLLPSSVGVSVERSQHHTPIPCTTTSHPIPTTMHPGQASYVQQAYGRVFRARHLFGGVYMAQQGRPCLNRRRNRKPRT